MAFGKKPQQIPEGEDKTPVSYRYESSLREEYGGHGALVHVE